MEVVYREERYRQCQLGDGVKAVVRQMNRDMR